MLARGAGFDFAVIDMEHGPLGIGELGQAAAAGIAAGMPVWGRVTGPHSDDVARVLDCGASAVVVPHVDSAQDAAQVARRCRFAPRGARALPGPLPALDYALLPASELTERAERGTRVVAMIESAAALEAVEGIAATEGIDMLMIGSNDLADGLGLRGQLDHPRVREAFETIAAAAQRHGCGFGVMGLPPQLVQSHGLALGAEVIVATNETNLVIEGGAALLERLRATEAEVTPARRPSGSRP
ncbi:2,4-dihydroxyhept-2-ene-1,7-dioic acid aldolase [Salipiger mucosus DSM 16094]|uniref:2,4-dihydroxyhept-2-ene-1,7-dioic acid aldolase n=1 Tax=Salipiger mucosus DSM 16094 TaxID=1123237 RepID=S9QWB9_9RHOB|nr:2,4-dihydroxyhept-2-ene-1,7-dioic acid aldolase [Salipiger mucosus DSM 16094]